MLKIKEMVSTYEAINKKFWKSFSKYRLIMKPLNLLDTMETGGIMKTLYLMRHGQTLFNLKRRIQGACDSPLTDKGIEQAKRAAKIVEDLDIDVAYCSTSERASDTLELVTRNTMPYIRYKELKERAFAVFEGESEDLHPQWQNGLDDIYPLFGGESTSDVMNRMVKKCTEIMHRDNHDNVLIVSHAGAISCFLREWLGNDKVNELRNQNSFENCSIVKLEFNPESEMFRLEKIIKPDFTGL